MSTLELLQYIGICKDVAHLVIDYIHFRDQTVVDELNIIINNAGFLFDSFECKYINYGTLSYRLIMGGRVHSRENYNRYCDLRLMLGILFNRIYRLRILCKIGLKE